MNIKNVKTSLTLLVSIGLITGILISTIDNFAFEGEVSPIIIVLLLLTATLAFGATFGLRGALMSIFTWICIPLTHLIKHIFNLPDTLHPNTYTSILMLAIFTLIVSSVGIGLGIFINKLFKKSVKFD